MIRVILMIVVFIMAILVGVRLVPPYLDGYAVQKALNTVVNTDNINSVTPNGIVDLFRRQLDVNSLAKTIDYKKLDITKDDGHVQLAIKYELRVHLVGNIDAVVMFDQAAVSK